MKHIFDILFLPALVGVIFVLAAAILYFFPPKKINYLYGYRTTASMKSQARWDFAQRYSAKKMIQAGIALCIVSLFGLILPIDETQNMVLGIFLLVPSCIFMFLTTERALRKNFPADVN